MERGPREQAFQVGFLASIVCVVRYRSNPRPTISWRGPLFHDLQDDGRYNFIDDNRGLRLEISRFTLEDVGTYRCEVFTVGTNVAFPNGTQNERTRVGPTEVFFFRAFPYSK